RSANPQNLIRVHVNRGDVLTRKPVRLAKGGEATVSKSVHAAALRADPKVTLLIVAERADVLGGKSIAGAKPFPAVCVEARQSALPPHQNDPLPVLINGGDVRLNRCGAGKGQERAVLKTEETRARRTL